MPWTRWGAVAMVLLAGCLREAYDPDREALIGPGTTRSACDAWLGNATGPSAVVLLERPKGVDRVEAVVDGESLGFRELDGNGCSAFPFLRGGLYRFNVWSSCTAIAETQWNGTADLEVWIPYYGNACA